EYINEVIRTETDIFIIGGAEIFKQTKEQIDLLYINTIKDEFDAEDPIYLPEDFLNNMVLINKVETNDVIYELYLSRFAYDFIK
ncbi:MAG: dihydrofolate reductase, partial [Halanaerobiales bacterium]